MNLVRTATWCTDRQSGNACKHSKHTAARCTSFLGSCTPLVPLFQAAAHAILASAHVFVKD